MALADILMTDGDVQEAKSVLTHTLHTLADAAEEYAKASLGASNAVLEVAMNGGPCAAAYTAYAEIGKFDRLARRAVSDLSGITNILLELNHSEDDYANEAYAEHLSNMCRINQTGALLEGAATRLGMINRSMPGNPQPAARFDASVFSTQEA